MADKGILELVQSSKNIIEADSDTENEMNNAAPVPTSSEMRNTMKNNLVALHFKYDFWHRTATAGSDVVQSGRPIFDDFFQHLWPYIGNNTANVVFQMVKRLWLIRIDQ
ncbi:adhesion G protein-coupled receptor B2 [Trichonephila clavipes]|uniref:Adhesion G protein-coupled receptor B2 n=1 Tax=Trichonephila clavipes TaxID=2585209 RepID=A0A8X6RSR2_TRICX|nr:adhesion G protein-coupled receptor B2 [Trichonephila clavipes]